MTDGRGDRALGGPGSSGSASVEQIGLILLLGLAITTLALILTVEQGPFSERGLANRLANRIACGPALPGSCRSHPVRDAYGPAAGRALRYFAPVPQPARDRLGRDLLPVDFRYCRTPGCAIPDPGRPEFDLTRSNRRTTMFTEVARTSAGFRLTWWLYRPGMPWEAIQRDVSAVDLTAAADTRLSLEDSPRLIPLEALDGRNHTRFGPGERPPWQWSVASNHDSRAE